MAPGVRRNGDPSAPTDGLASCRARRSTLDPVDGLSRSSFLWPTTWQGYPSAREFGTILRVGQVRGRDWRDSEHSGFDRAIGRISFAAVCNCQDSGPSFDSRSFSARSDVGECGYCFTIRENRAEVRGARRNNPMPVMDYRQSATTGRAGGMRKAPKRGRVVMFTLSRTDRVLGHARLSPGLGCTGLSSPHPQPTVLTQYPRDQNARPNKVPCVLISSRCIRTALLPFKYPTVIAMVYLGAGTLSSKVDVVWQGVALQKFGDLLLPAKLPKNSSISRRALPKNFLCRYFGRITTW